MVAIPHKAGFVSLIGKPNVGKSTLMNALVGEKLSIITAKAQTTRHRILGIVSGAHFQMIYADTPGIIQPAYALQAAMMRSVRHALADADVLLWVVDVHDRDLPHDWLGQERSQTTPLLLLINKIDLVDEATLAQTLQYWATQVQFSAMIPVSALQVHNIDRVFTHLLDYLPEHPPYYPKDMLTDKPERFFAAEIIREKILLHYHQEIPYSVEVVIDAFKEDKELIRIKAILYVDRERQKNILIGKNGSALKKVGTEARLDLEQFLGKKVFLEQHVKVMAGWRTQAQRLQTLGYA